LQIHSIIKERGLTQAGAATRLGIPQPQVSLRLMELLTALGQDIEIATRPTHKKHGHMYVVAA